MRRILAERVIEPSMMTTRPSGLQLTMGLPEADDSNRGHSGVQGYSEQVMHDATRLITVERAGGQRDDDDEFDGLFKVKLTNLKNADGDDVMDNTGGASYMGAEREYVPRYAQGITGAPAQNQLGTPKIIALENHRKGLGGITNSPSILAALLFWEEDGDGSTRFDLKMSRLLSKATETIVGGNGGSCEWETILTTLIDGSDDDDPNLTSGDNWPCVDGVEMEDGTVMVLWTDETTVRVCRLYGLDTVPAIIQVATFTPTGGAQIRHIGVERIGARIVCVHGYTTGAATDYYTRYSDDEGLTWSAEVQMVNGAAGGATGQSFDLVKAQDGWVYFVYTDPNQDVSLIRTSNGVNWYVNIGKTEIPGSGIAAYAGSMIGATMCQSQHGQWHLYVLTTADDQDHCRHLHCSSHDDPDAPFVAGVFNSSDTVLPYATDADCSVRAQCARSLNYGGFIDVASVIKDDASGDYYSIWVHRVGMWTGVAREVVDAWASLQNWDWCWTAHAYPSTSDGHPNLAMFTRFLTGASTSVLKDTHGGCLETYAAVGEDMYYTKVLADDSYDAGFKMAFEMRVTAVGDAKVVGRLTANANNKDCSFVLSFDYSTNTITLFDRVGATKTTFTPTNWSLKDWNYYELAMLGNDLYMYRAPSRSHREVAPMEAVINGFNMTEAAYTGQGNFVGFGCAEGSYAPSGATAKAEWRSVYIANDSINYSVAVRGRRLAPRPVGLLGNEGFKFNGNFHYVNDDWTIETRAIFDAANVMVASPSIVWKEPAQTVGSDSPARVFIIDLGEDSNNEDVDVPIHGFALFNRNFLNFQVEYLEAGGSIWQTLFDTGGDKAYLGPLTVGSMGKNRLVPKVSGGTIWSTLILQGLENLFSSDERKRWFVRFTNGDLSGTTYEIRTIDRAGRIVLYTNIEEVGGDVTGDGFVIFGSEFLFTLDVNDTPVFANQLKLTITSQSRPDTDESMQLGTLLLGRAMDLPDDEWNFNMTTKANLLVTGSRSGIQQVRRAGPEVTSIRTSYTGVQDRGMGRTTPRELFRFLGGGVYPLAWIDNDLPLDNDGDAGHHSPLLVRMVGTIDQSHKSYVRVIDDGSEGIEQGDENRNIMDVGGFVFEEVV